MMIGAGDLGVRIADMLIRRGKVGELTLVDLPGGGGASAGCVRRPFVGHV